MSFYDEKSGRVIDISEILKANPDTGFPDEYDFSEIGYYPIVPVQAPIVPANHVALIGEPKKIDGAYYQTWVVQREIEDKDEYASELMLQVNAKSNSQLKALIAEYPDMEVASWPQQVKEAENLNNAPRPLLEAIATARGIPLDALAMRVLQKSAAYAAASGAIIGERQRLEDLIASAVTIEELEGLSI